MPLDKITVDSISANAVTNVGIANGTIVSVDLADQAVIGTKLGLGAVSGNNISAGSIRGNNIVATTITGNNIATNTIRGNNIVAATITGNLIADGAISGNNIVSNAIRGNNIVAATITGNLISDFTIASEKLANTINLVSVSSNHFAFGARSGNVTVNVAQSNYFSVNTTNSCTWAFTGAPDSSKVLGFILEITAGGGNGVNVFTQTWPSSVRWPSGVAPTLSYGASNTDILVFITDDGGTNWRGVASQIDSR
jgi:hypothetical protein